MKESIKFRLLIKEHTETGLKYLCQTARENFVEYTGSGFYWKRHLKKHGKNLTTQIIGEYSTRKELRVAGKYYSELWNIVKSDEWANLVPEHGTGGDTSNSDGYKTGMQTRRSYAGTGNPNYGKCGKLSPNFGKKHGPNAKLSASTKKNWKNNSLRRNAASKRVIGAKNTSAKKCIIDNLEFGCLKEAAIYFGYQNEAKTHNYYKLRKNHTVIIL